MISFEEFTSIEIRSLAMLEVPTQQKQLWVVNRLYRICATTRNAAVVEPCLEQYEQRVRQVVGGEVTPAAAAWIELIAQCLRTGTVFSPEEFLR